MEIIILFFTSSGSTDDLAHLGNEAVSFHSLFVFGHLPESAD